MNKEENIKNLAVYKSNKLVQQSRNSLSLYEQRIINYLIAQIKKNDFKFEYVSIPYKELCNICGIENKNFTYTKNIIKKLYDKSIEIFDGKNYMPVKWLDDYIVNEQEFKLKFHFRMQPFLLQLKNNFTVGTLDFYLSFKNKYSGILYDYLRSYLNFIFTQETDKKIFDRYVEKTITLEKLRDMLVLDDKYELYKDIRKRIIEPTVNEINSITDITVEYAPIKQGRKVSEILFKIKLRPYIERLNITGDINE